MTGHLEERGVGEGLVVHVEDFDDSPLGVPHGVARNRGKAVAIAVFISCYLQLKQRRPLSASARARVPSANAVLLVPGEELKLHRHVLLALVDQFFLRARPGLAPQCPGNGVQEGGLAVAVVSAQACDVNAAEV